MGADSKIQSCPQIVGQDVTSGIWYQREKEAFSIPVEPEEPQRRVISSQDYSLKPMSLEEAFLQFDLTKKEIFVFRKLGSEKWAVIYRRKDGNYGLVEPE